MAIAKRSFRRLLITSVLAAGVAAGAPAFFGSSGALHQWTGLDFGYLVRPLALFGILLLLSRLVLWVYLAPRLVWRPVIAHRPRRIPMFTTVHRLLADSGWIALISGLLAAVPQLPATISAHPQSADLTSATAYLEAFDSLSLWVIFLLVPFAIVRAATEVLPRLGIIVGSPRSRIVALSVAYLLLANGGVLSAAFELSGSGILLALGAALGASYVAPVLRVVVESPLPPRPALLARGSLLLAEAACVVALLLVVPALTSALETVLTQQYAELESLESYLALLDSLAFWSMAVLAPFALVQLSGVFWPIARRILGFPIRHMILLAGVYVLFADNGILLTAFQVPVRQFMVVLTLALALSYGSSVLMNIANMQPSGRLGRSATIAAPAARAVALALVPAMVVWVCLNHLPVASARLLDHSPTHSFAEVHLPHFARWFEARYAIAGLCFATGLALTFPRVLQVSSPHYRPLLAAIGFGAAGCLAWIAGAGLSPLGHGYPLVAAIIAAGLFSLALTQLASYYFNASNPLVAGVARWLYESKTRGFILGASTAFYGLLLRPVAYELLWFAALYEYLAVLVLMLLALLRIGNLIRRDADAPNDPPPAWPRWSHHRQVLQVKVDPRSELMSRLQDRFIQSGDWKPLWTYLVGLLYRSEAPLGAVRAVGRPLRTSASSTRPWTLPGLQQRAKARRMTALVESMKAAEQALATPSRPLPPLDEETVRRAAAPYVETGADPEILAAILIAAHLQKGDDLEVVADRWFPLVNAPEPSPQWFHPPWARAQMMTRDKSARLHTVDEAVDYFFGNTSQRVAFSPGTTA